MQSRQKYFEGVHCSCDCFDLDLISECRSNQIMKICMLIEILTGLDISSSES